MTVTDQAAAEVKFRELEPREALLARLFDAMEAADEAVKGLVKHDLTALVPELEAARAEAEAALEAAEKAVEEPEAQVRAAEAGVRECAEKMTELAGSLADPDLHLRVESRRWYAEYERERNELQKKLDFAQLVAGPLHHARQEARNAYVQCCADLRALGLQIAYFPYGPDGQETDSYKLWRRDRGSLFPLLLNWDHKSPPSWPAAMTALRLACLATGYRGEDLPTEAEKAGMGPEEFRHGRRDEYPARPGAVDGRGHSSGQGWDSRTQPWNVARAASRITAPLPRYRVMRVSPIIGRCPRRGTSGSGRGRWLCRSDYLRVG